MAVAAPAPRLDAAVALVVLALLLPPPRPPPPPALSGCRRQDYSHSSDTGVRGSNAFKLGFYVNLNVQNIAQEWVVESRRLFYLRTINNVTNSIYKGTTPLRAGNLQNEPSEDRRGLNYPLLRNLSEHVSSKSIVNRHENTELVRQYMINQPVPSVFPISAVNNSVKQSMPRGSNVEIPWRDASNTEVILELDDKVLGDDKKKKDKKLVVKKVVSSLPTEACPVRGGTVVSVKTFGELNRA